MSPRVEVAVGGIVVRDGAVLLVRRGRGVATGLWSLPGGRVEPGETLAEAVEREMAEETGLAVRCERFVGWVDRRGEDHHYLIFDFLVEAADPSHAVAGDDASDVAWVPLVEVAGHPALVPGLVEFLAEHGLLGEESQRLISGRSTAGRASR